MKIKNLISIFVALLMLLASTAFAQTSGSCGDNATWSFDTESQTLTISGTGAMSDYTSSTSMPWVDFKDDIITVFINQGITIIGKYAFCGCANLNSVIIPDGVTSISNVAFCNCSNLTSVTIPESVTTIGQSAFKNCTSLSISIPKTVTTIEGKMTFNQVESLEYHGTATPPDGYPAWGAFSFNGSSFIFADNKKTILQYYIGKGGDIVVPEGVTTIGVEDKDRTFSNVYVETTITFPESLTTIKKVIWNPYVANQWLIKSIYFKNDPDKLQWTYSDWIQGYFICYVSPQTLDIWQEKFGDLEHYAISFVANGVEFEQNGVVYILSEDGSATVKGYTASIPNELVIPSTITKDGVNYRVTNIQERAFRSCTKLTSVIIPDGVTKIKDYTFYECTNLTSVNIPEGVTTIGDGAFYGSRGLTSINIPESVTSIGEMAFEGVFDTEVWWHASPDVFKSGIFSSHIPQIHVPAETFDAFNEKYGSKYNFVGDIKKISNNDITILTQTYTGSELTPVVKDGEKTLVEGEDYTITLSEGGCTNVGEYTVTLIGKKLYYKSAEKKFTIKQATPTISIPENLSLKCNQTLTDITLPKGFAFDDINAELTLGKTNTVTATFTPEDTKNYVIVKNIDIKVAVADHVHADPVKENEDVATTEKSGSYDEVIYCSVCGKELSRDTKTVPAIKPEPNPSTPVSFVADSPSVNVWSYNHTIYIENATDTEYTIIDLNGRIIKSATTKSTKEEIRIDKSGILIVIIDKQSFKISL